MSIVYAMIQNSCDNEPMFGPVQLLSGHENKKW